MTRAALLRVLVACAHRQKPAGVTRRSQGLKDRWAHWTPHDTRRVRVASSAQRDSSFVYDTGGHPERES
jgi:hypothetical protein